MTDGELDDVYTALCEALGNAGPARAQQLLLQPPSLPTRIPFTLQAMQRDTLQLYTSLVG